MALPVANTSEGGSAGTTVTVANSGGASGNAYDTVTAPNAGATLAFQNDQPKAIGEGKLAVKIVGPTTSAANPDVRWTTTSVGSVSRIFGRVYVYPVTWTTVNQRFVKVFNGTTQLCGIFITTGGVLTISDTADATIVSPTVSLSPFQNQLWRFEFDLTPGTATNNGAITVNAYKGNDAALFGQIAMTAKNFGGLTNAQEVRYGNLNATTATQHTFYLDGLNLNTTGMPGPATPWVPRPPWPQVVGVQRASTW